MSLAVAFEALGRKLEEEGVVTPTTEAEASVSVHITPEEQTVIDEEVSQYEQVTEAITEAQTAVADADQAEDAEATMSAIVYSIKKHNGVSPQMYAFLQQAGYLDLIARHQSSSLNKVTYPGVEELSTSNTKDVAAQLLAGCEAVLNRIKEGAKKILTAIWEAILKLWERLTVFVERFTASGRVDRIAKELDAVDKNFDVKGIKYAGYTKDQIKEAVYFVNDAFVFEALDKLMSIKSVADLKNKGQEFHRFMNELHQDIADNRVYKYNERLLYRSSDDQTFGVAGVTLADMQTGGSLYLLIKDITKNASKYKSALSKVKNIVKVMSAGKFVAEKMEDNEDISSEIKAYRDDLGKYIQVLSALTAVITKSVSNYQSSGGAILAAFKKAEKANA